MKLIRYLLWPFSLLYGGIMLLRNKFYDWGWLKSHRFHVPVISVGNLTVGGTGKTPHVEYLLRLLQDHNRAVLSRGYKRQSKGFVLADHSATAQSLGDEPFQYHRDFPEVTVAVCERRPEGIEKLLQLHTPPEVIVLDDAMQHRPVQPSFSIMLTDYKRPFYRDFVLPAGLLREFRSGAQRADVVVVSKCPANIAQTDRAGIAQEVGRYRGTEGKVFFSSFRYGKPVEMGNSSTICNRIVLLTGIANAKPLMDYLEEQGYTITQHIAHADHHHYTLQDMARLREIVESEGRGLISIVTTRKDAVKLMDSSLIEKTSQLPLFYIAIEVFFLERGDEFDELVRRHIAGFKAL
jgi:tetraacyldisaccharide 4'-kinase